MPVLFKEYWWYDKKVKRWRDEKGRFVGGLPNPWRIYEWLEEESKCRKSKQNKSEK